MRHTLTPWYDGCVELNGGEAGTLPNFEERAESSKMGERETAKVSFRPTLGQLYYSSRKPVEDSDITYTTARITAVVSMAAVLPPSGESNGLGSSQNGGVPVKRKRWVIIRQCDESIPST